MNLKKSYYLAVIAYILLACSSGKQQVEWVSTTENSQWENHTGLYVMPVETDSGFDAVIYPQEHLQTIMGFGACFNELGWTSLANLPETVRDEIMMELFASGKGANFNICRMPIGANDFSHNWYSYNETDGDFEMADFSIANDEETLIPFISEAKRHNPQLKIWASPWCPPSWMKYNRHYACRPDAQVNDLKGDPETDLEGTNMFIQDEKYMKAYSLYFGKFIDAYKQKGIDIFMVAPQNEFNSCQNFPSCTWTASALAQFMTYLIPEMEKRNIEIMLGTIERPSSAMIDTILNNPKVGQHIKSAGFQWAGKDAIAYVFEHYPNLILYQTEQECGNGKNDWSNAAYSWNLMKHYLSNGAGVYNYWNISLEKGGISRWGWAQNSLVVVDTVTKSFEYTLEYYVLKHFSHYIQPGAKRLKTDGYNNLLAFLNNDGSIVITAGNFENKEISVKIKWGKNVIQPALSANSIHTFIIK